MSTTLLYTKLAIPPVRPTLVARPRLWHLLDGALEARLTLVSAPAGYGKTTLLADWAQRTISGTGPAPEPLSPTLFLSWLSLDEEDNDPVRFLAYLAAALQMAGLDAGAAALAAVQAPQLPAVETIAALLLNDLTATGSLVVILDDYHVIKSQRIHELVAYLLEHAPPHLHLVASGRADPPLPLARLRGRGQLLELRQRDLRFTGAEAAAFLGEAMNLDLAAADMERLNRRTEGWIAGLQMAAASLRQREDASHFIAAFSGSNRYILDYLLEEVLHREAAQVQHFLLRTAVLDRLEAGLCAHVLGENGDQAPADQVREAQRVLEYLEGANLFVVPLDEQRRWYRYHRLFADLLRRRLEMSAPQEMPRLHRRAGAWYRQHDEPDQALAHFLAAGEYVAAADMVEATAEAMLARSEGATLLRCLEALPEAIVRERPALSLYYAWALLLQGAALETAVSYVPPTAQQDERLAQKAMLMDAFLAAMRGQMNRARTVARQAYEQIGVDEPFWRSIAAWVLSMTAVAPGHPPADEALTLQEATRIGRESGNLMVAVSALCEQAHAHKRQGRLQQARTLFTEALALATEPGGQRLPVAGEALMGLGELALEWNDLAEAEVLLLDGIEQTSLWREVAAMPGYLQLARLRHAQRDAPGTDAALDEAARLAAHFDASELDDLVVAAYRARFWVEQGRLHLARRWAEERPRQGPDLTGEALALEGRMEELYRFQELILARLLIAEGDLAAALRLLVPLLELFGSWRHARLIIETQLLRARAFAGLRDLERAAAALREALAIGEPGRFVRSFLNEGTVVGRLLAMQQPASAGEEAYMATLRAAFAALEEEPAPDERQPLVEPLSERELEVLGLIAAGLTNREIAQRLFLSLPTVKWHAGNIYGKLGVKNRTAAVARARSLQLLPGP